MKYKSKKTERIYLRVSIETKENLTNKVKKHKTTISHYLTSILLNKKIKVQAIPDENTIKLKNELNIIGKNLWTLIKYNKTLKLTEKVNLERIILELKRTLQSINSYYGS